MWERTLKASKNMLFGGNQVHTDLSEIQLSTLIYVLTICNLQLRALISSAYVNLLSLSLRDTDT